MTKPTPIAPDLSPADLLQGIASNELFGQLVFNLPEGIWVRNANDSIMLYVNPSMQRLTGGKAKSGAHVQELFALAHPEDIPALQKEFATRPMGGFNQDCRVRTSDGTYRWVSLRSFPLINDSGEVHQVAGILTDIHDRKLAEHNLVELAHHDPLTGLPNRIMFGALLDKHLFRAEQMEAGLSVAFIDLDGFKQVNDTLGHRLGDLLLQQVAKRFKALFKDPDTYVLGRLGGDEFGLLIAAPQPTQSLAKPLSLQPDEPVTFSGFDDALSHHEIHKKTELAVSRLIASLSQPFFLEGKPVSISASAGVTRYPQDSVDASTLLRYADTAMYEAKAAGRKTYAFYHDGMDQKITDRRELEQALRQAVQRKEFTLYYQPKIDIKTQRWVGVEALMRWERAGEVDVLPVMFMSALEDTGLIIPLGAWAIEEACRQMAAWTKQGLPPVRVAVNVSARQFAPGESSVAAYQDMQLADVVMRSLKENPGVPLELELTESTLMTQSEHAVSAMRKCQLMGVHWSIDDFGTGYSSLAYLKRFPIKTLKIDMAFIQDVTTNAEDAAIVSAIVSMAHSLKLNVVAEGVETKDQMFLLRSLDVDQAQGFVIEKPMTAADATIWLRSHPSM